MTETISVKKPPAYSNKSEWPVIAGIQDLGKLIIGQVNLSTARAKLVCPTMVLLIRDYSLIPNSDQDRIMIRATKRTGIVKRLRVVFFVVV